MTVKEVLQNLNQQIIRTEAEILLAHLLGQDKTFLYAHPEHQLHPRQIQSFQKLIQRRLAGEPIPYLVGEQEFYGLTFFVNQNTFIPRPETETLIDLALERIKIRLNNKGKIKLADIGTGCGAICLALAKALEQAKTSTKIEFYAVEINQKALFVAKKNYQRHQIRIPISFLRGDLLEPLPTKVDFILANLPYVKSTFLKRPSKKSCITIYEPLEALNGGTDGLKLLKRLLKQSLTYLKRGGEILLEIDPRQLDPLIKFVEALFSRVELTIRKDLRGLERVILIRPV